MSIDRLKPAFVDADFDQVIQLVHALRYMSAPRRALADKFGPRTDFSHDLRLDGGGGSHVGC